MAGRNDGKSRVGRPRGSAPLSSCICVYEYTCTGVSVFVWLFVVASVQECSCTRIVSDGECAYV